MKTGGCSSKATVEAKGHSGGAKEATHGFDEDSHTQQARHTKEKRLWM